MAAFGRAVGLAALVLAASCDRGAPAEEALPRIARVPDAELVAQDGRPFRAASLEGEVWVADFFFTSCRTICPRLTSQLRNLGRRHEGLHLVSFSVDPATDTPERLRDYARRFEADLDLWTFVTGEPAVVREAIVKGFKLHYGDPRPLEDAEDPDAYDIAHSTYFALVDREGWIRGYYRNDRESITRLDADVERLLR